MNKRGFSVFLGLMLFVFIFILANVLIDPMKDFITDSRDGDSLDCTNSSITIGERGTCIVVDLSLPLFVALLIFGAGYYVLGGFGKQGG